MLQQFNNRNSLSGVSYQATLDLAIKKTHNNTGPYVNQRMHQQLQYYQTNHIQGSRVSYNRYRIWSKSISKPFYTLVHFCYIYIYLCTAYNKFSHIYIPATANTDILITCLQWGSSLSPSGHPADPSLIYLESQSCGKDQWWPAAWQSDWWFFGMVFSHTSCSKGCTQGTTHLLSGLSLKNKKKKFQCCKKYDYFKC